MHFRPPEEQNDHKVTCGVRNDALGRVKQLIEAALTAGAVEANIITSGTGGGGGRGPRAHAACGVPWKPCASCRHATCGTGTAAAAAARAARHRAWIPNGWPVAPCPGDWRFLDLVPLRAGKLEALEYVRQVCMRAPCAPRAPIACVLHACMHRKRRTRASHARCMRAPCAPCMRSWLPGQHALFCGSNAAATAAYHARTQRPVSASPNDLLQSHGFPLDATVACGDSGNDILMLSGRNLAVAVGNSQVSSTRGLAPCSVPAALLACRRVRRRGLVRPHP